MNYSRFSLILIGLILFCNFGCINKTDEETTKTTTTAPSGATTSTPSASTYPYGTVTVVVSRKDNGLKIAGAIVDYDWERDTTGWTGSKGSTNSIGKLIATTPDRLSSYGGYVGLSIRSVKASGYKTIWGGNIESAGVTHIVSNYCTKDNPSQTLGILMEKE